MDTLTGLDIVRNVSPDSVRAQTTDNSDSLGTLSVAFSVFDTWYEVSSFWEGNFLERTVKSSFARTIQEDRSNIKALFDHGYDPSIGNKVLGPIRSLNEEPNGPVGDVDLMKTSYNADLLPGLQAGVYGSSFRFSVRKDEWDDDPGVSTYNPKGLPERTITDVTLYEFGPVTFPASAAATAGMRMASGTDPYYEKVALHNPAIRSTLERSRANHPVRNARSKNQVRAALLKRGIKL